MSNVTLNFNFTFHLKQQIGPKVGVVSFVISHCNRMCPEDCSKDHWVNVTEVGDSSADQSVLFDCSTFPRITESVEACLEHFNYSDHPNAGLLPTRCGKQKTGVKNTVRRKI